MSFPQKYAKCLHDLTTMQEYRDAVQQAAEAEKDELMPLLRNATREGKSIEAARYEAQICVYEGLLKFLERYAAEYRVSST